MARSVGFNPIIRTVSNGGIWFNTRHYKDKALAAYEGADVLLDPVIDADTDCFTGFSVCDTDEIEICEITLELDDEPGY